MLEIIKETLLELKKIKTENNESKESLNNSVRNLEFIIKEYKRLIDDFKYDQEKVSKFIGKSRSHISNSLRLLSLQRELLVT